MLAQKYSQVVSCRYQLAENDAARVIATATVKTFAVKIIPSETFFRMLILTLHNIVIGITVTN